MFPVFGLVGHKFYLSTCCEGTHRTLEHFCIEMICNDVFCDCGGMEEEIPDDVVVVLPEAPEAPADSKDHVMEVPGIEGKVYKCEYCLFNSNDKSKVAKHVVTNHLCL
jgi:hypothetical protein